PSTAKAAQTSTPSETAGTTASAVRRPEPSAMAIVLKTFGPGDATFAPNTVSAVAISVQGKGGGDVTGRHSGSAALCARARCASMRRSRGRPSGEIFTANALFDEQRIT